MDLFTEIRNAENVRLKFAEYLESYKITVKDFKAIPTPGQIGLVYHFLTKHQVNINVALNKYSIYFNPDKESLELLQSMAITGIVFLEDPMYYLEHKKSYTGTVFIGLQEACIETIKFMNSTKWIHHLQSTPQT